MSVLSYWRTLELFSPQSVPALARGESTRQVVEWRPGEPTPWSSLPAPASGREWQHQVYLGIYELSDMYEALHAAFVDDPDAHDLRPGGRSACAGVVVDGEGKLISGAAVLSSCAWGLGAARRGVRGTHWLNTFGHAAQGFAAQIDEQEEDLREECGSSTWIPVTPARLVELLGEAKAATGLDLTPGLTATGVVIQSTQRTTQDAESMAHTDFLNSFFLDDLAQVQDAAAAGEVGAALRAYLTPEDELDTSCRHDVVGRDRDVVSTWTTPDLIPVGRWPSDPRHPLALSQQLALNLALSRLSDNGLMAINGPPGTGKTTLLRDLIAANLTERASRLANLERPSDAFTSTRHRWQSESWPRDVPVLHGDISGFEMVVASTNNAAVQNVTDEIPGAAAVAESWRGRVDHFTDLASEILRQGAQARPPKRRTGEEPELHDEAWALVAARLGNRTNRNRFVSAFWFSKEDVSGVAGMQEILDGWLTEPAPPWAEATAAFRLAHARVEALRDERSAAAEHLTVLVGTRERLAALPREEASACDDLDMAQATLADLQSAVDACSAERDGLVLVHERHLRVRPRWWESVITLGSADRAWRQQLMPLEEQLRCADERLSGAREDHRHFAGHEADLAGRVEYLQEERRLLAHTLEKLEEQCARDEAHLGKTYPGTSWVDDEREKRAPWTDPEINQARSDLFIASLALHHSFIRCQARSMKRWLRSVLDVVSGRVPDTLGEAERRAAWQLFFLVVPVVSTTFASVSRMFAGLGAESIGWLLIDEAGQASPQQAAGAIWRSRRVLALGDPLQLEPVVTLPPKASLDIAATFDVPARWIPPGASVQTLADRVTPFGTTLHSRNDPVWVGSPLRVHRRCDDPMFAISNSIAYSGLMISAVDRDPYLLPTQTVDAPPSYWAHVVGDEEETHLQPREIARLTAGIDYLHDICGVPYDEMFALSPFRAVAEALREIAVRYPGMKGGTVHTAQGQEADVVFLVLGTSPSKNGSRAWAASTPNLLNVAVSRARRRLYVFGDADRWGDHPYFDVLAASLPRRVRPDDLSAPTSHH